MITLAALLPRQWDIKLVNRNAEELKPEDIDWADMVMTGGMLSQRNDTLLLIECFTSSKTFEYIWMKRR